LLALRGLEKSSAYVAHLLQLPHLGRGRVGRSLVLDVARRAGAEEQRGEVVIGGLSLAVERVAHQPDDRPAQLGPGVVGDRVDDLVPERDCPLFGRDSLGEVVAVEDCVGPPVAVQLRRRSARVMLIRGEA
jgi:hypothetical protein